VNTRRKLLWAIGILGILLTGRAYATLAIVNGLTHDQSAKPGESYEKVIVIRNEGDAQAEAKLYQTDYQFFCDGRVSYGDPPGKLPRSNAAWVTLKTKRVTLAPGEVTNVTVTVKVPDDQTLKGTYWSMVMVEEVGPASREAKAEEQKIKLGILQVVRYGIQMITNIGDTGTRMLKFAEVKLVKEDKLRVLQIDMENPGERVLTPTVTVEAYDEKAALVGKFEAGRLRIYPGTSARFKADMSKLVKGKYKALVVADCGGDDVFGATYTLQVEE